MLARPAPAADQAFRSAQCDPPRCRRRKAIGFHNQTSGNYLALSGDPDQAVFNMGKRISAGMRMQTNTATV
jgi:hypothetical protein